MKISTRRRPAWAVSMLALVCVFATAALPGAVAERRPLPRALAAAPVAGEARVIVKFKAESGLMGALSANSMAAPPQHAQTLSSRLGLNLTDGRPIGARAQVVMAKGMSSVQLAERLAAQSDVEYAVVDERKHALAAPNDPLYGVQSATAPAAGQWYLRAPNSSTIVNATSVLSAINAEAAWNITTGSSNVVVAVLDTGVRLDHPDLAPKLRPGYDFVRASISNDGDGADADPSDPGDGCGTTTNDWHGTQVSGLVGAATNNGIGMAGAGRDVMLLPVRVLGCGGGFDSDIQAGMLWAAGLSATPTPNAYPAKVVNLSLGSNGACSMAYRDTVAQLNNAGVVVVAAAGNEGIAVGTPANCPGVIAVAGVRHAGTKVGYSDLGPEIAVAAPAGNCVNASGTCLFPLLTTSNKGRTTPIADSSGGSAYTDGGASPSLGTSFSAPLVSGTVALMFSANPSLTPAQVTTALRSTARAFPTSGAASIRRADNGPFVPVAACDAPTSLTDLSTAQGYECYCTTGTCGAGLLDAGAAVARAAAGVAVANIATSTNVPVGNVLQLGGALSRASAATATVQSYAWSVLAGASIARITSATNASTAALVGSAPGTAVVGLTVTDSAGRSATTSTKLTIAGPTGAEIAFSPGTVIAGAVVELDGSASHASVGSIATYQWAITGGSSFASLSGAANESMVKLSATAPGDVVVSLTVTDSLGKTATTSRTVTVSPVPSSGGGGAMGVWWLLGLLTAMASVRAVTPRGLRGCPDA